MWEPRRLTSLWAFTACYRDSFTSFFTEGILKGNFEFRNSRNGTRVVTKEIDFSTICSHFENNILPYFTFYHKSHKPIRAVIRYLPFITPAEDISDGLVNLGFDVISVKQMSTSRRSPTEGTTIPRTSKTHEMFRITSLYRIAFRVEA
jgi:hypothetical protein